MKTPSTGPEFFSSDVSESRRFYLILNPRKDERLAVVCGGKERVRANYAVHRRSFPFYGIEFVMKGHGTLILRGRKYTLQPGAIFFCGPGVDHDITSSPDDPLLKYFVNFIGKQAGPMLRACQLPAGDVGQLYPPMVLDVLFEEMITCALRRRPHTGELCAKLLECLALKIMDTCVGLEEAATLSFATYQKCRHHIQQHCLRLHTLGQIAGECNIDGAYLCRLFRRYDQQTPYHFLLHLKMSAAVEQLLESGATVKQVAMQMGFDDESHFSHVFKSVYGVPPITFRTIR